MNDTSLQDQQSKQQVNNSGLFQPTAGQSPQPIEQHVTWIPSSSKEIEYGASVKPEIGLSPVTAEKELPKEVENVGVTIKKTTIELPPNLQSIGIQTVPPQTPTPISDQGPKLPLTDDQIAAGLKQDFFSSWRWFSEWCMRKLKQAHITVKNVQGRFVRVKV
jgi:hypothetical protein